MGDIRERLFVSEYVFGRLFVSVPKRTRPSAAAREGGLRRIAPGPDCSAVGVAFAAAARGIGGPTTPLIVWATIQFLTVRLTPELNALPLELKASDKRAYEPLGTVVVFQLHNHPYWVGVAVQSTGPE
jgi:hypothetical protein